MTKTPSTDQQQEVAEFKTSDLALSALLRAEGYVSNIVPAREGSAEACWVFPRDGKMDSIVASYVGGDYRIEPKKFMENLAKTRHQLHQFMNDLHS